MESWLLGYIPCLFKTQPDVLPLAATCWRVRHCLEAWESIHWVIAPHQPRSPVVKKKITLNLLWNLREFLGMNFFYRMPTHTLLVSKKSKQGKSYGKQRPATDGEIFSLFYLRGTFSDPAVFDSYAAVLLLPSRLCPRRVGVGNPLVPPFCTLCSVNQQKAAVETEKLWSWTPEITSPSPRLLLTWARLLPSLPTLVREPPLPSRARPGTTTTVSITT